MSPEEFGRQLKLLRHRLDLNLRELSRRSGVAASTLSAIEQGKTSPTLATVDKLLEALGVDFASFFAGGADSAAGQVFTADHMQKVQDAHRTYQFLLPAREDIKVEMLHEVINPSEKDSEWETHPYDLAGWMAAGDTMRLEIQEVGRWDLRPGDAWYIKAGQLHRATNTGAAPMEIITVIPPRR
ncbi:MAG: helix-turn-helix domain-containing protein [Lentisphaeria bacterium]